MDVIENKIPASFRNKFDYEVIQIIQYLKTEINFIGPNVRDREKKYSQRTRSGTEFGEKEGKCLQAHKI